MKKSSICIGDSGAIISLAIIGKLDLLDFWFDNIYIPEAVWCELIENDNFVEVLSIKSFFAKRVKKIQTINDLKLIMDKGESEAVILYREMNADVLLIDDKKAKEIAKKIGVQCIGVLTLLAKSKDANVIDNLRNIFLQLIENKRYFSKQLLNSILREFNEKPI